MASLSILIPCLSDPQRLEQTVLSVLTSCENPLEILVLDRTGYHDPYGLDRSELSLVPAASDTPLSELLNQGLRLAQGDVVHIVGCGLEVSTGWYEPALSWFADDSIGSVTPACWHQLAASADDGETVSLGIHLNTEWQRTETELAADQLRSEAHSQRVQGPAWFAAFYRTEWLRAVGGFDDEFGDALLDLDLALRLEDEGATCMVEPRSQLLRRRHCESIRVGAIEYGRQAQRLLDAYAANPAKVTRRALWGDLWGGFVAPRRWLQSWGRWQTLRQETLSQETLRQETLRQAASTGNVLELDAGERESVVPATHKLAPLDATEPSDTQEFIRRAA